jgi:hypothetical protein
MKHLKTCLQLKNERIQKETVVFTELADYYSNEKKIAFGDWEQREISQGETGQPVIRK